MNTKGNQAGSITIEACVVVLLFMFLILTLYSFFVIFGAQGKIKSVLIQSAESLSLDQHMNENVPEDWLDAGNVQTLLLKFTVNMTASGDGFANTTKWYEAGTDGDQAKVVAAVRERFLAYFSGGDAAAADELLLSYRIVGGYSGLDFSESNVDASGNLNIVVKYEQKYFFDYPLFGLENIRREEKVVSHLWK